jgi:putative MFS transporter
VAKHANPWYIALFFGRSAELPPGATRTLALVSLGVFFENYDIGLVNAALKQIAESLGLPAGETGWYLGTIRLGGLGAFLILPFADLIGRRRVFLIALVGMSIGTFATALSQTPVQFALCQMVARVFMLTAVALSIVILAEELPAEHRAAGIGMSSVLGGLGFGVVAGLYAFVDSIPFGWRTLYSVGLLPLLCVPFFRRSLRETVRFERGHRERPLSEIFGSWFGPILLLARRDTRRTLTVGLAGVLGAAGGIAFFQYTSWFVQEVHGWKPGQYTLLVLGAGTLGVFGNVIGGRGSDRWGRRRVGFLSWLFVPLFVALFYHGPWWALGLAWGFGVLLGASGEVVMRAIATELFDTSHRATAAGWLIFVQTLGWSFGLFIVGFGADSFEELPRMISWVACGSALAAFCLLLIPETSRRELESIVAEDASALAAPDER